MVMAFMSEPGRSRSCVHRDSFVVVDAKACGFALRSDAAREIAELDVRVNQLDCLMVGSQANLEKTLTVNLNWTPFVGPRRLGFKV